MKRCTTTLALHALLVGGIALLHALPCGAADGVAEINQLAVDEALYPCDDGSPGAPCTLWRAGSYRLTGNLTVTDPDGTGVSITAAGVTLDLGGFAVLGPNTCTFNGATATVSCSPGGLGRGIYSSAEAVTIRNGTVAGFGRWGISLGSLSRVEDVVVRGAEESGIRTGAHSVVVDTMVAVAGTSGLRLGDGGRAQGVILHHCGHPYALDGQTEVSVLDSVVLEGGTAFSAGDGSLVAGCVAHDSVGSYIHVGERSAVVGSVSSSGTRGISAGTGAGWAGNVLYGYSSAPFGGVQMGANLCNGAVCP